MKWLREIKEAVAIRLPRPSDKSGQLDTSQDVKGLLTKRNLSTTGPDKLVNYWWKPADGLHEGITQTFFLSLKATGSIPHGSQKAKRSSFRIPAISRLRTSSLGHAYVTSKSGLYLVSRAPWTVI